MKLLLYSKWGLLCHFPLRTAYPNIPSQELNPVQSCPQTWQQTILWFYIYFQYAEHNFSLFGKRHERYSPLHRTLSGTVRVRPSLSVSYAPRLSRERWGKHCTKWRQRVRGRLRHGQLANHFANSSRELTLLSEMEYRTQLPYHEWPNHLLQNGEET